MADSTGVTLDLPSEIPSGTPIFPTRDRLVANWAAPALLKPIRLMMDSDSVSRNNRGRGLPCWACAVTVPTSTKPKPSAAHAFSATPSLSIPAARPTAEGKSTPNTVRGAGCARCSRPSTASACFERDTRDSTAKVR